jgi:hypothetical protein
MPSSRHLQASSRRSSEASTKADEAGSGSDFALPHPRRGLKYRIDGSLLARSCFLFRLQASSVFPLRPSFA